MGRLRPCDRISSHSDRGDAPVRKLDPILRRKTRDGGAHELRRYCAGTERIESVDENSVTKFKPPPTAFSNSGYCATFSPNTLLAAPVAVAVEADSSNALAPASAAASSALCKRDLLSSTCAVSTAKPAMAIRANMPTSTSTKVAPRSRRGTMAISYCPPTLTITGLETVLAITRRNAHGSHGRVEQVGIRAFDWGRVRPRQCRAIIDLIFGHLCD